MRDAPAPAGSAAGQLKLSHWQLSSAERLCRLLGRTKQDNKMAVLYNICRVLTDHPTRARWLAPRFASFSRGAQVSFANAH